LLTAAICTAGFTCPCWGAVKGSAAFTVSDKNTFQPPQKVRFFDGEFVFKLVGIDQLTQMAKGVESAIKYKEEALKNKNTNEKGDAEIAVLTSFEPQKSDSQSNQDKYIGIYRLETPNYISFDRDLIVYVTESEKGIVADKVYCKYPHYCGNGNICDSTLFYREFMLIPRYDGANEESLIAALLAMVLYRFILEFEFAGGEKYFQHEDSKVLLQDFRERRVLHPMVVLECMHCFECEKIDKAQQLAKECPACHKVSCGFIAALHEIPLNQKSCIIASVPFGLAYVLNGFKK